MATNQIGIIISIVIYLFGMLIVGFVASKKTNDVEDFYLGGRKLGPLVTAMSAEASDMSSYLLMGLPGLGYFGMPHILLRFMAIENPNKLKLSRRVASIWVVISLFVATFLGIVGRAMTQVGELDSLLDQSDLTSAAKAETLVVVLADKISKHGIFFGILAGIVLAGIKLSEKSQMIVARATLVVVAVLGVIIAWNPDSVIEKEFEDVKAM